MRRGFFCLLVAFLLHGSLYALRVDSVYKLRVNPLLENFLKERPRFFYPVYTRAYHVMQDDFDVVVLKTPQQLYMSILNTGYLFKLTDQNDSILTFNRIDRTSAIFYNISAYYFTIGEDIYNFAGYGFWKNNGILRKYNFINAEWDVYPLSQEIIPQISPVLSVWYNSYDTTLYVPFQRIMNAGLKGGENSTGKIVDKAYFLDLKSGKWDLLGNTSKAAQEIFTKGFVLYLIDFDRGQMVLSNDNLYWIDYASNKIHICRNSFFVQTFMRSIKNPISYMHGDTIYFYAAHIQKLDSLKIDFSYFQPTGEAVWENGISTYLYGIPLFIALAFFSYLRFRKKSFRGFDSSIPAAVATKEQKLHFDDAESRLLQLLIEKSESNMRCTIEEINYILGLRDKNLGLQKKIRSDVINSINQKYRYFSGSDMHLVLSIRSEEDKRYFEYYLDPQKVKEIEGLLIM